MALVKKSKIAPDAVKAPQAKAPATIAPAASPASRAPASKQQTIFERVAAATEELASGLTEASAATKELGRSMEQIAAGAEEAAGASQEQSAAIKRIVENLNAARAEAEKSARRSETLTETLTQSTTQIVASVASIERNAERQLGSLEVIAELERRANDIGEITEAVSRISDQTNLLALNAAIEAARAGDHGRGFAVVADEVRALAETSDRNAQQVRQLAASINNDVKGVVASLKQAAQTAAKEAKAAVSVVDDLGARRDDMAKIVAGAGDIITAATEAERSAIEAERGAEQVASAAEEQSSGAGEAQSAIQQQAKSLQQAQIAAQSLAVLAENLRRGTGAASAADQIGASAEELSATIQELSSAANQIMAAVEQINRACQLQASATQQTSAALAQIESSAKLAADNGRIADLSVQTIDSALQGGRKSVENLINGVMQGATDTRSSITTVARLGTVGRNIEKIIDAIALIGVQTSMLAVSGSVEAARAGESGRGFAIVSNDIRGLAREAASNVERAKDTVRGILDQIVILKNDLEQIVLTSETEVRTNRAVSTMLERIGTDVGELGGSSKKILHGAAEILAATVETATGARQVAAAAEEASAASRQAATAATQQSRGAEDLAAAIEEIASLADELKRQNA